MGDEHTGLRDTVAATGSHNAATRDARSAFEFTRGSLINRYVVLERLGAGGMSIVYAAYDPELRRRVALKLLLVDVGADQARLLREARAIARLSHPNVVTVFDVGTFEGRVYVTMEYIDGQTLRGWWTETPRTWPEILAVFMDAARGLSAAHAAGLIHRDFKPENVLIGKDGRVRVLDFGLARRAGGDLETSIARSYDSVVIPGTDVFRMQISRDGALVGTPAYMAPEQLADGTIDHRADQFSFCVALFEGLFGRRPFKGNTAIEMLTAVAQGNLDLTDTRKIPGPLLRVLRRGLSVHASLRYTSMDELTRALARAGSARRFALAAWLGGGSLALAAGLYGWFAVAQPEPQAARCLDAEQRIAEVWNRARADAVDASLKATGKPYAKDTARLVRDQLDHYAAAWRAAHQLVCDASYVHEIQDTARLHAQLACLDDHLADMRTAVEIFEQADADVVEHAVQAASELPAPDRCDDGREHEATLPADKAASVQQVRDTLSRIRVEGVAGRIGHARELAREAVDQANAAGYAPIQAEAQLHLGLAELAADDIVAADERLNEAYDLSEAAGTDAIRAAAATHLVRVTGLRGRDTEALMWARLARAAIAGRGRPAQLQVALHSNLAAVHQRAARYSDAVVELNHAIKLDSGGATYRVARYHAALGRLIGYHLRRHKEALDVYDLAFRLGSTTLGVNHPDVAQYLEAHAWTQLHLGEIDAAETDYKEALADLTAAHGADHLDLRRSINGLGTLALMRGDFATAATHYTRVRELVTLHKGPESELLLSSTINLAETKDRAHAAKVALHLAEQARSICDHEYGPDHDDCSYILALIARIQVQLGRLDLAAPLVDRAVTTLERTQGQAFPDLMRPLYVQGTIALASDRPADAIVPLERALVLARTVYEFPLEHAELRLALADALWRTDRDRPLARKLALEAQTRLRDLAPTVGQIEMLARADAWLTAHPAS